MTYLLDTNVVSEVRKASGSTRVKAWLALRSGDELYISALVIGEIRRGVERLRGRDPQRTAVLDVWLARLVQQFSRRILPISADIAEEWGRMNAPDPLPIIDGLMAATAKVHGLTFVTRNTRDVARTGVRLFDPWAFNPGVN